MPFYAFFGKCISNDNGREINNETMKKKRLKFAMNKGKEEELSSEVAN